MSPLQLYAAIPSWLSYETNAEMYAENQAAVFQNHLTNEELFSPWKKRRGRGGLSPFSETPDHQQSKTGFTMLPSWPGSVSAKKLMCDASVLPPSSLTLRDLMSVFIFCHKAPSYSSNSIWKWNSARESLRSMLYFSKCIQCISRHQNHLWSRFTSNVISCIFFCCYTPFSSGAESFFISQVWTLFFDVKN